jgi:AAA domain (dynein-related subfamily)
MRDVKVGDLVIHLTDNEAITGVSTVAGLADDKFMGLKGTEWDGQPGYRVSLQDFARVDPALMREEFLKGSKVEEAMRNVYSKLAGKGLFFNKALELNQGAYLTSAPPELVTVLNNAYSDKTGRPLPGLAAFSSEDAGPNSAIEILEPPTPYSIEQATAGLFISQAQFAGILNRLQSKKNVILQGAPGVGKTFIARRLAFALMEQMDYDRIQMVQFHLSYSYEDFVHGYRPKQDGSFDRRICPCDNCGGRFTTKMTFNRRVANYLSTFS